MRRLTSEPSFGRMLIPALVAKLALTAQEEAADNLYKIRVILRFGTKNIPSRASSRAELVEITCVQLL